MAEQANDDEIPTVGDIGAATLARVDYEARHHPLRTIGVAFGVGLVLGRGVPRVATRLGIVVGARLLADAMLRRALGDGEHGRSPPPRAPNGQYAPRSRTDPPD